jgi:hypothetical protein
VNVNRASRKRKISCLAINRSKIGHQQPFIRNALLKKRIFSFPTIGLGEASEHNYTSHD